MSARLVIVSHRGPGGGGGVASGLDAVLRRTAGCWIASDGVPRPYPLRRIELSPAESEGYYRGYANGGLWPLCHTLVERASFRGEQWECYRRVNARFAEAAAEAAAPGAAVWVHDYQLALVPAMLRERRPDLRIGFFWHIPWPSPGIWRLCPQDGAILSGILGADVIGMHTEAYVTAFRAVAGPMAPARSLPMGVDFEGIATAAMQAPMERRMRRMAKTLRVADQTVLLGVDRCDYTKGIPQRLSAVTALFRQSPEYRGRVTFVQVASPTRAGIRSYERLRRLIRAQAVAINREFSRPGWSPVRLLTRRLDFPQILALYRLAAAAVVTPLVDGMNLVAKEFCAARVDDQGCLVLSRTAGAATQLATAVFANPLYPDGLASAMRTAIAMAPDEQRLRMRGLREEVRRHDIYGWLQANLGALGIEVEGLGRAPLRTALADRWEPAAGLQALPVRRTVPGPGHRVRHALPELPPQPSS
ncbi:MAG TPA: trehalose-6-phosphate synthase [Bacillota bacterium]|nr:trehalose-6-phosphate synthase [Bacillota bacterium]